ncbi:tetratricopeptide repeat protein [Marispirochaeta sp.]|uniref:tetratricopeptide repeat protein n=1 Tax=Marispirochaeta sp. TaxID=2038653 RepID=UPI0029C87DE1|nr:tetratricopeptide repeat protein [Marispirochaeta sp.]
MKRMLQKNLLVYVLLVLLILLCAFSVGISMLITSRNEKSLSDLHDLLKKQSDVLDEQKDLISGQQQLLDDYTRALTSFEMPSGTYVLSTEERRLLLRGIREEFGTRLEGIEHKLDTVDVREISHFEATTNYLYQLAEEGTGHYQRLHRQMELMNTDLNAHFDGLTSTITAIESLPQTLLASEYRQFGDTSRDDGEYGDAVEYYRKSAGYQETNETLLRYAESLYLADPAVRKDAEIIKSLLTVLERDPVNSGALILLGDVYLEQGNLNDAEMYYERLVRLEPENGAARKRLGEIYLKIEEFEKAVRHLITAGELLPDDPVVPCELGDAYFTLGDYEAAETAYSRALSVRYPFPPALMGRGNSRSALGLLDKAAEDISAYVKLRPRDYHALVELGDVYERMGMNAEALKSWEKARGALSLNSDKDILRWGDVSRRQARLCLSLGDYRGTLFYVDKGLELARDKELLALGMTAADKMGDDDSHRRYSRQMGALEERGMAE